MPSEETPTAVPQSPHPVRPGVPFEIEDTRIARPEFSDGVALAVAGPGSLVATAFVSNAPKPGLPPVAVTASKAKHSANTAQNAGTFESGCLLTPDFVATYAETLKMTTSPTEYVVKEFHEPLNFMPDEVDAGAGVGPTALTIAAFVEGAPLGDTGISGSIAKPVSYPVFTKSASCCNDEGMLPE